MYYTFVNFAGQNEVKRVSCFLAVVEFMTDQLMNCTGQVNKCFQRYILNASMQSNYICAYICVFMYTSVTCMHAFYEFLAGIRLFII